MSSVRSLYKKEVIECESEYCFTGQRLDISPKFALSSIWTSKKKQEKNKTYNIKTVQNGLYLLFPMENLQKKMIK